MDDFIDAEPDRRTSTRRGKLLLLAAVLVALVLAGRAMLSYWVDLLWFDSLGFGRVFWKTAGVEAGAFLCFAVITFLLLFGPFWVIRRSHEADLPRARSIVIGGQAVHFSVAPALRVISLLVALAVSLISGLTMMAEWPTLALFWYAPRASGNVVDPIFGRPLNFFLFTLPALQLIAGWLLTLAFATCAVAVLFLFITSGSRSLVERRLSYGSNPWRGLSMTGSFLLLVLALEVYLSRFELLLEHHTLFDGITYTGAHITVHGLSIVALALVLGAAVLAYNAARDANVRWIVASVIPAAVCYLALTAVGWYVSTFLVKPNQLVREQPFISHNIEFTRRAFGIDRFTRSEFPAEATIAAAEPANNQSTFNNIRLWDWRALRDTLRQVQEIRTYYDFPDIDIDRYDLNGTIREVMLAARELNVDKLPVSSRNWINEKLIYTHGYGVTMNPVNGFTPEGLPVLLLSNMPVESTVPGLKVTRPQIYFGQLTDTDVYVKTRQQEFDYPQGQSNTLTSYQGSGGIVLGSWFRRALIAIDRDDAGTLPFSDDVTPESRLLMRRNIRDRVQRLAPFLRFDGDPYLVVGEDGRLFWMMDAYTSSDSYPYSTHYGIGDSSINYMRNSVKAVIDVYNGAVTFYDFDAEDPILAAYRDIFPDLFRDASSMPADLKRHIRYPEDLFTVQSQVYTLYHMTDPSVFFNREDLWSVATETVTDSSGQQNVEPMQPNYILMKLPGGSGEEFVQILPFTPANRNNLIGWMAGRSDGAAYGTAVVYNFPKTRLIDGPQQIEARIDQNAQLSGQLTLWNQQGSHVLRGSLLVIPTGHALLYAEPIYLQAQQSPMPELRLVVLALQDQLAYGTTFRAALAALFEGQPSSLNPIEATAPGTSAPPGTAATAEPAGTPQPAATSPLPASQPPAPTRALIAEAGKDFDDYQRLTAAGRLGEAGQKLDALKHVLDQLSRQGR